MKKNDDKHKILSKSSPLTTWHQMAAQQAKEGSNIVGDRYLVGAAVQYSYSSFVLQQGGPGGKKRNMVSGAIPSMKGRERSSSTSPPSRTTVLSHSLLTSHSLIYSFYVINIYPESKCTGTAPDKLGPSTVQGVPARATF